MGDFFLEKGNQPGWNKVFKSMGVSPPTPLKRVRGELKKDVLSDKKIVTGAASGGISKDVFKAVYKELGASGIVTTLADKEKANGLVFDATGIKTVAELKDLYNFFHTYSKRSLKTCSRVVLIVNTVPSSVEEYKGDADGYEEYCAMHRGMEGFMRSLAKELGGKGTTVTLLRITDASKVNEQTLLPYLHFLLSDAPTFFTSQVIEINTDISLGELAKIEKPLTGKTAIVTGSARGIGEATARQLAAAGATVVIHDLPKAEAAGKAVADSIGGKFFGADMSTAEAPRIIADFVKNELGGSVDIVIHNAGITLDKTLANMKEKQWDLVMSINLKSIVETNKLLLNEGLINQNGRIVALASISGVAGNNGQTNYAMSKAGVIGYVKSLSQSSLLTDKGITINAVAPGFTESEMTAKMPAAIAFFGRRLSSLNQGGQPVDIGNVITFLASPGIAATTGQTLRVCGGGFVGA